MTFDNDENDTGTRKLGQGGIKQSTFSYHARTFDLGVLSSLWDNVVQAMKGAEVFQALGCGSVQKRHT